MTIDDRRRLIDEIDKKLVELLNERARCAMEIGHLKRSQDLPVYQPEREQEILDNVERLNHGPLEGTAIRRLFERVIDEARSLERAARQAGTSPEYDSAQAGDLKQKP
ncbi:MAG: chorismate mutase [Candidatus Acidiferrales bacterium]